MYGVSVFGVHCAVNVWSWAKFTVSPSATVVDGCS